MEDYAFDPHALRVLEYDKVLERLCSYCQWSPGSEFLRALTPSLDLEELQLRQQEVREALILLEAGGGLGLGGVTDVRGAVTAAGRGAVLGAGVLLDVRQLLVSTRRTAKDLSARKHTEPRLAGWGELLVASPDLERTLRESIGPDARVLDSASPKLGRLRSEIRSLESKVQGSFDRVLRDSEMRRMLQEPLVTVRQRRHVVPVKAEHRGQFPGLVIDQSGSGATVFMEPYAVVDEGNKLRSAQLAEEREVEAVLGRLSGAVGEQAQRLLENCELLARLDAIFALAQYASSHAAEFPTLVEDGPLKLEGARHPLLADEAVPISVSVGDGFHTLVITGPNTGGKTVGLKTLGLLTAMGLHGMPIPASSDSVLPLLEGIWADIGDEQSIAQSLSTFSAHLTQILRILPRAGRRSLVLVDELGAGTDPAEGGALGVALLEALSKRGCFTVLTTHLSQLKVFAAENEDFENAAVEFDAASLRPTYRVLMGIPGRSNALQIADRLGLPGDILRRAREHLGEGHVGVEGLLEDLEHERESVRRLEVALESDSRQAKELRRDYEERMAQAEQESAALLAKAAAEADQMVLEARQKVHGLLQEFRTRVKMLGQARREALGKARKLQEHWEGVQVEAPPPTVSETPEPEPELTDQLEERARLEARAIEAELAEMREELAEHRIEEKQPEGQDLAAGTPVYARKFGQEGEVLEQRGNKVEVRLGAIRMTVDREDLEVVRPAKQKSTVVLPSSGRDTISPRVDLRGMTVDEALFELDRRLDAAAMAKLEKCEIIHGKGTGALRKAVTRHLERHPQVASKRLGEVYEGGWGVTVVNLKL